MATLVQCMICGKVIKQGLCEDCVEAQDHHPEEVAAREIEIDATIRRLAEDYAHDYHYDMEGYGSNNDPAACLQELVEYVLGLLK